jgi:hypothetical protein
LDIILKEFVKNITLFGSIPQLAVIISEGLQSVILLASSLAANPIN